MENGNVVVVKRFIFLLWHLLMIVYCWWSTRNLATICVQPIELLPTGKEWLINFGLDVAGTTDEVLIHLKHNQLGISFVLPILHIYNATEPTFSYAHPLYVHTQLARNSNLCGEDILSVIRIFVTIDGDQVIFLPDQLWIILNESFYPTVDSFVKCHNYSVIWTINQSVIIWTLDFWNDLLELNQEEGLLVQPIQVTFDVF